MDRRKARIHPKQLTDETYKTKPGTFPMIPSQQKLLAGCKVSGPKNSIRRCRHANALSGPKLDHISCKPHMGFDLLRSQFFFSQTLIVFISRKCLRPRCRCRCAPHVALSSNEMVKPRGPHQLSNFRIRIIQNNKPPLLSCYDWQHHCSVQPRGSCSGLVPGQATY